jgi:putative transposase
VFIPKYRQKRFYGGIRNDVREIIRKLCEYKKVEIVNGAVCKDHVHLNLIIPPKLSIAEFVGYLKGKSALMLYDKRPEQRSKWDKSLWARGYYVATVGTITEDVIKKYIAEQEETSRKEDKSGASL